MKKLTIIIAAAALAACGTPEADVQPAPTVTVTEEVTAEPTTEVEDEILEDITSDPDLQRMVMKMTWEDTALEDRVSICDGWAYEEARPSLIDVFMSSSDGSFSEDVVVDFFNEECP